MFRSCMMQELGDVTRLFLLYIGSVISVQLMHALQIVMKVFAADRLAQILDKSEQIRDSLSILTNLSRIK